VSIRIAMVSKSWVTVSAPAIPLLAASPVGAIPSLSSLAPMRKQLRRVAFSAP
jgi:hypothetical protein